MRSVKRCITALALLVLCICLMAVSVSAAENGSCGGELKWTLDKGTLTISGTGSMVDYPYASKQPWYNYRSDILQIVIKDGVTSIGKNAFRDLDNLAKITFGKNVATIGENAFYDCDAITTVTIGDGVTTIGEGAFKNCSNLVNLTIGKSVQSIENQAFYNCGSLARVTMGNNVTSIGNSSFWNCCSLAQITFSNKLESIGNEAFAYCYGLSSLNLPSSLKVIYLEAFQDCTSLTSITIPNGVTDIGSRAFKGCSNASVVKLGTGLTTIWEDAFRECGVTTLVIPNNVQTLDEGAFRNCDKLTKVTIGSGVEVIGANAFYDCNALTSVTISNGVAEIGSEAFRYCNALTSISIPESVTTIGSYAFYYCTSLTTANLSNGITNIGQSAFEQCTALKNITFSQNLTVVGEKAFTRCTALKSVVIPGSILSGGAGMFSRCENLTTAVIEDGAFSIPESMFYSCTSLTKVQIPASAGTIGREAFGECTALAHVYFTGSKAVGNNVAIAAGNAPVNAAKIHYNSTMPLATPTISKFENTASGIKITWKPVTGAAKYRVFVKTSSGWSSIGTTTGTSLLYKGVKSGKTYTFTVRCLNIPANAYTSSFNSTGWKRTYVAQPKITKLENTASGVKITWNAVSGAGKYKVFVKTSSGWSAVGTTTGTSLVYKGAKSGKTYTFTVRCMNASGKAYTSSYNTTGWKRAFVAQPKISQMETTSSGIKINWNKVSGAAKYRVYVKTSSGWSAIGTTTGTSLVYKGAKTGKTYTFTIRCLNASGAAVSSYNTSGWKHAFLAQPSISKLTKTSSGIKLTWKAVSGAERYRIYVKTSSGWSCIGNTTGTSFTWSGAKKGTTYTFTIRCVNDANSAFTSTCNTTGWKIKYS